MTAVKARAPRFALEALEDRTVPASLVADINTATLSADPNRFTDVNGTLFFFANDGVSGRELWKTDGTAAGTALVKDINPGAADSVFQWDSVPMAALNGVLYFAASDGVNGQELWRSDGTAAGTFMVKNVSPGTALSGTISNIKATGNRVYYTSFVFGQGTELFASDGTAAGTNLVLDINPGSASSVPEQLTAVGNTLYFVATTTATGRELWRTNGTAAGTTLVRDLTPGAGSSNIQNLTRSGSRVFFTFNDPASGFELWRSNGTSSGTVLVKDIRTGTAGSSPTQLTDVNGTLFFAADDGVAGRELWKTTGSAASTVLVKDINPGGTGGTFPQSGNPFNLTASNGKLFFAASDGLSGTELFSSDGTAAGTNLVVNLAPGGGSTNFGSLADVNGTLYFTTTDFSTPTLKLYTTDGTAAGTTFVDTLNADFGTKLTAAGGKAYFTERTPLTGAELSVSNGTAIGTGNIRDVNQAPASSQPREITEFDGSLFFVADSPTAGAELWVINQDGLMQVTDVPGAAGADPFNLFVAAGRLWFFGYTSNGQGSTPVLYSTNSYGDDTEAVFDFTDELGGFFGGYYVVNFSDITKVGERGYFTVSIYDVSWDYDLVETQLWVVDGPGYTAVKADTAFDITALAEFNGELYYGRNGDLWKLGANFAPTQVTDLAPTGFALVYEFEKFNGKLYFSAFTNTTGTEVWVTDGTAAGTVLAADVAAGAASSNARQLTAAGNALFFTATGATGGEELYKIDLAGAASLVKDVAPGAASSGITNLFAIGNTLYFSATDGTSGQELYASDGTTAGTNLVADLNAGAAGSNPASLTNVNGTLYFVATTAATGRELYKLQNGAPVLVEDLNLGAASGFPVGTFSSRLLFAGGMLYFAADDGATGVELFAIQVS